MGEAISSCSSRELEAALCFDLGHPLVDHLVVFADGHLPLRGLRQRENRSSHLSMPIRKSVASKLGELSLLCHFVPFDIADRAG